MKLTIAALMACLTATAGCTAGQERQQEIKTAYLAAFAKATQEAADDKQCISYGTQPGTDKYAGCRLALAHLHGDAER